MLVDDKWGRKLAANFHLEVHGTLCILQRFQELGLITATDLRRHFLALRELGIRLRWGKVDTLLDNLGEEPLLGDRAKVCLLTALATPPLTMAGRG